MIEPLCAIGFSGHRDLADSAIVEREVARLMDEIGRKTTRRLIGVCSVAIGADVIFIEACLKRKLPWIAILPMPPEIFFNNKDFPDEASGKNAMRLLETAASVEITNPAGDHLLRDEREYRHVAFSDSGRRIVDYCDVFIGALRPPRDPLKAGGTRDITQYAKLCHRPAAIINPETGAIEHHHWHLPFTSAFIDEIVSLPEAPLRQDFLTAKSSDDFRTVVDVFSRLAAAAHRHVPRLRNISSIAAILNGILAVLTLAFALLPELFTGLADYVAHKVNALLSVLAAVATGWFILRKPQEQAARYRLAAEICRSLIATWNLPETHREIFRGLPSEQNELAKLLLNFRRSEASSLAEVSAAKITELETWKKPISDYVKDRIKEQVGYYEREQKKARLRLHIFKPIIAIFSLGNLFIAVCLRVAQSRGYFPTPEIENVMAFFEVAFPSITGTFIAILAAREANRRKGRYGEMLKVLNENAQRLKFAPHKAAAADIVIDIERALLSENIEWANTARYGAT